MTNEQQQRGLGISLPISKANAHLMIIWNALDREWPITLEQVQAELKEAHLHMSDLDALDPDMFSSQTMFSWNNLIADILDAITGFSAITAAVGSLETAMNKEDMPKLEELVAASWDMLALVDRELAGLTMQEAFPGTVP